MSNEYKLKYINDYNKNKCRSYSLKLSYKYHSDIIDYFSKFGCQNVVVLAVRKLISEKKYKND